MVTIHLGFLILCLYIYPFKVENCLPAGESLDEYLSLLFHISKSHSAAKIGLLHLSSRYLLYIRKQAWSVMYSDLSETKNKHCVSCCCVGVGYGQRGWSVRNLTAGLVMELGNDVKHFSWVEVHILLRNSSHTQIHWPQHDSYGPQPASQVFDGGTALISKAKTSQNTSTSTN